ncbi:hypothetical protein VW23_009675 [Devosia insulae DS-56]|uniref:DUF2244 domain-containing protein n=2 Tax=Devosia insulae TaxID=408174 RepID=A0A1E5XW34_9HYPH|nr:hypothetical protein VW23_009675 [Devosia insulae DS-56]
MPKMTTQTQARPLFAAKLTPHRSLGRKGFRVVIVLVAVLATIPGIIFFSMGAWPIVGFLGLDIALIWWAMRSSQRDGKRYEEVTLWPDQLEIKQVDGTGKETLSRFNPYFVKLVVDRDYNERTVGLHLRTRDRDIMLGQFLNQDEKSSFAKAFGTALKRARV